MLREFTEKLNIVVLRVACVGSSNNLNSPLRDSMRLTVYSISIYSPRTPKLDRDCRDQHGYRVARDYFPTEKADPEVIARAEGWGLLPLPVIMEPSTHLHGGILIYLQPCPLPPTLIADYEPCGQVRLILQRGTMEKPLNTVRLKRKPHYHEHQIKAGEKPNTVTFYCRGEDGWEYSLHCHYPGGDLDYQGGDEDEYLERDLSAP